MSHTKLIRKAVFPVAGFGTRMLPATKALPKEMITVVDKPVLQYVVDEAIEAGIEHFVFVTGRNKAAIEDYFDIQFELEQTLKERNKKAELTLLEKQRLRREVALYSFEDNRRRIQREKAEAEAKARAAEEARLAAEAQARQRAADEQRRREAESVPQLTVPPTGDIFRQDGLAPGAAGN